MKLQSVTIAAVVGAFFLMHGPAAQAQAQSSPQAPAPEAQTPAPADTSAAGKDRSIVNVPNAGNAAAQSAVRAQRDDIARRAKEREMR